MFVQIIKFTGTFSSLLSEGVYVGPFDSLEKLRNFSNHWKRKMNKCEVMNPLHRGFYQFQFITKDKLISTPQTIISPEDFMY